MPTPRTGGVFGSTTFGSTTTGKKKAKKATSAFRSGTLGGFGSAIGVPAKPVAPASATPGVSPGPLPWDQNYEQTKATLIRNRDTSLANVTADKSTLSQNYGFNLDGTENSIDPYSRLSTLRADFEKLKRGSSGSFAARGQLYAGSYQNRVNSNQESHNRGYDSLKKDFSQQATGLRDRETDIHSQYNSGLTSAGNQRTSDAANSVATGESPVATPAAPDRRSVVLAALKTHLTPRTRERLRNEARKNGWIS